MADSRGFASFIKSKSENYLKIMIVGVATTESNLLLDHESLNRTLVPVAIPQMSGVEIKGIIENAQKYLEENNLDYEFDKSAVEYLTNVSRGFPWFVHLLGREALIEAFERNGEMPPTIQQILFQRN